MDSHGGESVCGHISHAPEAQCLPTHAHTHTLGLLSEVHWMSWRHTQCLEGRGPCTEHQRVPLSNVEGQQNTNNMVGSDFKKRFILKASVRQQ